MDFGMAMRDHGMVGMFETIVQRREFHNLVFTDGYVKVCSLPIRGEGGRGRCARSGLPNRRFG